MFSVNCLNKNDIVVAKKSYVAYIKPMGIWFIVWLLISSESFLLSIPLLFVGYGIYTYINSYKLFINDDGVWVCRGNMQWNTGIYGLRWDEFGMAQFYQDPISWTLKSYRIEVKHKYKEQAEIVLEHMLHGDIAVTQINEVAMRLKRS